MICYEYKTVGKFDVLQILVEVLMNFWCASSEQRKGDHHNQYSDQFEKGNASQRGQSSMLYHAAWQSQSLENKHFVKYFESHHQS